MVNGQRIKHYISGTPINVETNIINIITPQEYIRDVYQPVSDPENEEESKQELCHRVLKLEEENDDLSELNFMLKWKLNKLKTASTTPPPSPPKEDN